MTTRIFFPLVDICVTLVLKRISRKDFCAERQHRANQVRVRASQEALHGLDNHDFAAEVGINGTEFHADVATADHQQILRNFFHLQRFGRGHNARVSQVEQLGQGRFGTDRNDAFLKGHEALPFGSLHAQNLRTFKVAAAVEDLDSPLFGEETDPGGEFGHDGILPGAQFIQVDLGRAKVMPRWADSRASTITLAAWRRALEGMQPRLRQTPPRLFILLHEQDLFAKIGGEESRRVSAGPGAEHQNFSMDRFHSIVLYDYFSSNFSKPCTMSSMNRTAAPPSMTR